ncbi:hypothetical protein CsSME_00041002 [Camellia sinensis var. sinensis]
MRRLRKRAFKFVAIAKPGRLDEVVNSNRAVTALTTAISSEIINWAIWILIKERQRVLIFDHRRRVFLSENIIERFLSSLESHTVLKHARLVLQILLFHKHLAYVLENCIFIFRRIRIGGLSYIAGIWNIWNDTKLMIHKISL